MGLMLTPRNQGESGSERDCSAPMPPPITASNVPHITDGANISSAPCQPSSFISTTTTQIPSFISTASSQLPSQISTASSQLPSQISTAPSQLPSQISAASSQLPSQISASSSQFPSQMGRRRSSSLSTSPLMALSPAANHNGNVNSSRVNSSLGIDRSSASTSMHGSSTGAGISNLLSSHTQVNNQP